MVCVLGMRGTTVAWVEAGGVYLLLYCWGVAVLVFGV